MPKPTNAEWQLIAEILDGAADLVGRSPYPLVEAAERLGVKFTSRIFAWARETRDAYVTSYKNLRVRDSREPVEKLATLEAALIAGGHYG